MTDHILCRTVELIFAFQGRRWKFMPTRLDVCYFVDFGWGLHSRRRSDTRDTRWTDITGEGRDTKRRRCSECGELVILEADLEADIRDISSCRHGVNVIKVECLQLPNPLHG